jgi:Skp family chaperone for outer membrane proteins
VFKEYGIRLHFTPTILGGDLINLKVKPEVSSLDFTNAIVLDGFRLPALTTRRTDTEVELQDGQTFAIAGLMNNTLNSTIQKIPGIGDIPVLGLLFKSRAYQKNETELVVMITPTIIRRGSTGVSPALPSLLEPYMAPPSKTVPPPAPYVGSPRYPANQPAPRGGNEPAPAPQPAPVSRPIQGAASLPAAPVLAPSTPPLAARDAASEPVANKPSAPKAPTKAELKALEQQRLDERKAADAAARQKAIDDRKAEEDHRAADRLQKERALREAEVAKRNAEIARKKAEEDQKHDKALSDAAARLKQAQAAYQAEMEKAKGIKK